MPKTTITLLHLTEADPDAPYSAPSVGGDVRRRYFVHGDHSSDTDAVVAALKNAGFVEHEGPRAERIPHYPPRSPDPVTAGSVSV